MRRFLALPLVALVALLAAEASNAGREQQVLTCGSYGTLTVTVTTTKTDHSVAWGTGKVSSPRLLGIPVSFSGTTTDLTTGAVLGFFFSSRRRHTRSVSAFLLNRSSDLRKTESANGVHLEGVASDNRS